MISRPLVVIAVLALLLGGAIACTRQAAPVAAPSTPSPLPTAQPATRTPSTSGGFHLNADQAAAVAVTVDFLNAYNAGDLDAALRVLGPDPGFSDCDYLAQQAVDTHGRTQVASRLKERFNDHSLIVWSEIGTENPQGNALGVTVTRVKSDGLTKLGFPDGVHPPAAAKVIFTADHRIAQFALGPVGGSSTACRPRS